jgi:hypothetical protein
MNLGLDVRERAVAWLDGVYLGGGVRAGQGSVGGELVDPRRRVDLELGEDVALGLGDLGALAECAGWAGEGADGDSLQLAAQGGPGGVAGGLGDPDQEQGEPAQDDVGAGAFLLAVVDRPQVDDLLHVTPAALDFQQLLVAQGDVLGRQARIAGAQQVLAVQVLLGCRCPARRCSRAPRPTPAAERHCG